MWNVQRFEYVSLIDWNQKIKDWNLISIYLRAVARDLYTSSQDAARGDQLPNEAANA